jgi:CspA family cold shock protein
VQGVVTQFDGHIGRGVVVTANGTQYGFHCVQIADGSRAIAVGTEVEFAVVPGPLGQWEAAHIRPQ